MKKTVLKQLILIVLVLIANLSIASCSLIDEFMGVAPPLTISPTLRVNQIAAEVMEDISYKSLLWIVDEMQISKILVYLSRFSQRKWNYPLGDTAPALPNHLVLNRDAELDFSIYFGNGAIGGTQKGDNLDARFTNMSEQEEKELKALIYGD